MSEKLTPRQMLNVEIAARAANRNSTKILKRHIPKEEQSSLKLAFTCECADPDCQDRIMLTLHEYDDLHKNHARFVVAKDHVAPNIESVKEDKQGIAIVEKYALS